MADAAPQETKVEGFLELVTHFITKIVTFVPLLGPMVKQFLPSDKPSYKSATVKAGIIWGMIATLCQSIPAVFPAAKVYCDSINNLFVVLGPALMILGVRKTVIDNSTSNGGK